jgi:hypothetical protein
VNVAFTHWKAMYTQTEQVALNIHKLGPSKKYTGNRDGACQVNFIRYMASGTKARFNVHINVPAAVAEGRERSGGWHWWLSVHKCALTHSGPYEAK